MDDFMKRTLTALAFGVCVTVLVPSCSLFKKVTHRTPAQASQTPAAPEQPAPAPAVTPAQPEAPATTGKKAPKLYKVALFTPLYLDQVTRDTAFSVSSPAPLPGGALAGLEFYEGALLAQDSLQQDGIGVQLEVYDTKSATQPLGRLISSGKLDSANLLLGAVSGSELTELSRFAKQRHIHFVSATYPNDAGVRDNPYLTILNSTLQAHCTAIEQFVQQKFTDRNIIVIYQDNAQEKQNLSYLQAAYQKDGTGGKSPLRPLAWGNETTTAQLTPLLDKNKNNVIIITALYRQVAESIIGQLVSLTQTYTLNVVGMPTLDGDANLRSPTYKGLSIYYSTPYPYAYAANNAAINQMMWDFFRKYRSRPSDMALKGFESLYYLGKLLPGGEKRFNQNLTREEGSLLTRFRIRPVYAGGGASDRQPDYYENTHLYFMQIRDGKIIPAS
jgi:hypothetical protein